MSCKKLIDVPAPINEVVTSQVFADSSDATSAVLGIYINMTGNYGNILLCNGGTTIYTGLSGDELTYSASSNLIKEFANDAVSPTDNTYNLNFLWRDGFQYVYQANACIQGLSSSKGISVTTKNQLLGEAYFVRAFLYFNLYNLYGNVPLATTISYNSNSTLPRATATEIYNQIQSDLSMAQNLLPVNYATGGHLRPNKYTATALLAKVYLYNKQWAKVDSASSAIINSNIYSLESNLNNVFNDGSNEAIWQILSVIPYQDTDEGNFLVPSSAGVIPKYIISSSLLNAFENGDQRYSNWLNVNVVNGVSYYYPYKYIGGISGAQDYMIFRLAEQYLIRAEAEAEGAGSGINGAISDLNVIRNRAGLPNYEGATDESSVLNAIMHERRIELFCEWGNRWFDLKRTGTINTTLSAEKSIWPSDGHAALYPIPLTQLQADPFLVQNPGY